MQEHSGLFGPSYEKDQSKDCITNKPKIAPLTNQKLHRNKPKIAP